MKLKGSYCHEGTKGTRKAVYSVEFKTAEEAFEHIQSKFAVEDVVTHFWYGYHINAVNKVAKAEKEARDGYDKAEEILDGDFPNSKFERDVEKTIGISPEEKTLLTLIKGKGLSQAQVKELLEGLKE